MTPPPGPAPVDPAALLRTRSYVQLLLLAAIIGVPVSCVAYGFLWLVSQLQAPLFSALPERLVYATAPDWWPIPVLAVGGLLTAGAIRRLPGTGGRHPSAGFSARRCPA